MVKRVPQVGLQMTSLRGGGFPKPSDLRGGGAFINPVLLLSNPIRG